MDDPTQSPPLHSDPLLWDFEPLANTDFSYLPPGPSSTWQQDGGSFTTQHNFAPASNAVHLDQGFPLNVWGGGNYGLGSSRGQTGSSVSSDSRPRAAASVDNVSPAPEFDENFKLFLEIFKSLPLTEQQKLVNQSAETKGFDLVERLELHRIFMANLERESNRLLNGNGGNSHQSPNGTIGSKEHDSGSGGESENYVTKKSKKPKSGKEKKTKATKKVQLEEEMPYRCPCCTVGCRDKTSLRKHMYIHDPRRFFCDTCGMGFHTRRDLRRHQNAIHNGSSGLTGKSPRKFYICKKSKCDRGMEKPFSRKDNAKQHVVAVHGIENAMAEDVIELIELTDGDTSPASSSDPVDEHASLTTEDNEEKRPLQSEAADIRNRNSRFVSTKGTANGSEDVLAEFTHLQDPTPETPQPLRKGQKGGRSSTRASKKPHLDNATETSGPSVSRIGVPHGNQSMDPQFEDSNISALLLALGKTPNDLLEDPELWNLLQQCMQEPNPTSTQETIPQDWQDLFEGMQTLHL
ncbi:hypothetical protein TWF694_006701 [Orbilia ellipsospora]|uniref:C2H2-type domain-containing protein n=1 Tax=Orbilia ellipsospora TaxID=2528407 RepID=A0AAV9XLU3_9PEZI